jgi:hypothetical protein
MSDLFTFNLNNSGEIQYRIRYNNLNLMQHSLFLRKQILNHGRTTFQLTDLRNHKYHHHNLEALKEVIHWLAENCKVKQFYYNDKQLEWDESQQSLIWRGWKMRRQNGVLRPPDFERKVPWMPLDCGIKINGRHGPSFEKALWMFVYMFQLGLDERLRPTMERMREALLVWLKRNVLTLMEVELLWELCGKSQKDEEVAEVGLRRFVETVYFSGPLRSEEVRNEEEAFVKGLPAELLGRIWRWDIETRLGRGFGS